ncbi:hypothetical protein ABIA69_000600 [Lysinibacillus parviboronicapiens]|uniref:Uncharacterized protein n=1 Tax=Lysinibacillus parviboronicapiens TaxID=436516 RepID=A0ABV2PES8_9BACI
MNAASRQLLNQCDAYVMHGGTVGEVAEKIKDMITRRESAGKASFETFGMAAYCS